MTRRTTAGGHDHFEMHRTVPGSRGPGSERHLVKSGTEFRNFSLLTGLRPLDVSHWFWAGFVDASEWVELPNVHGMALAADSTFTTKPYAASGAYIARMSNHCTGCRYKVRQRHGPDACPLNALFWDFMVRNRPALETNPRIAVLYRSWDRWDLAEQSAIRSSAATFLQTLTPAEQGWAFQDDDG